MVDGGDLGVKSAYYAPRRKGRLAKIAYYQHVVDRRVNPSNVNVLRFEEPPITDPRARWLVWEGSGEIRPYPDHLLCNHSFNDQVRVLWVFRRSVCRLEFEPTEPIDH